MRGSISAVASVLFALCPLLSRAAEAPPAAEKPHIDIVFCIDCSGSMGPVIETAKQKVWAIVNEKKIPVTRPNLELTFKTDDLRGQIKAFSRQKLADEECLAKTVELTEALSNKPVEDARARAWATGDLAKLQELPPRSFSATRKGRIFSTPESRPM